MGTITPLVRREPIREGVGRWARPGRITVSIDADRTWIQLRVSGARAPARLYLYVDGDLAETWVGPEAVYELAPGTLAAGAHAVTARAVDALGRWGGASTIVEL